MLSDLVMILMIADESYAAGEATRKSVKLKQKQKNRSLNIRPLNLVPEPIFSLECPEIDLRSRELGSVKFSDYRN
jgi:hypothetical protein